VEAPKVGDRVKFLRAIHSRAWAVAKYDIGIVTLVLLGDRYIKTDLTGDVNWAWEDPTLFEFLGRAGQNTLPSHTQRYAQNFDEFDVNTVWKAVEEFSLR
jgi:hypothetical protein